MSGAISRCSSIIQERYDGGRAPIGDLEQTIERVEAAKALVAQIKVARETAKAKYKNAVGVPPSALKPVSYATGIPKSVADVTNRAVRNNPRVKEAIAETEVSYFDKEQFRSTLYPQVFLEGNATRGEDLDGTPGRNNELEARVVLRWKLFDGGVRRNRTAELGERYSEKVAEQMILVRELTQEVEIAWARLVDGRAEVDAIQREVAQNIKVVASYQDEYNANKRSLLDVLDAENAKFASQFELSQRDRAARLLQLRAARADGRAAEDAWRPGAGQSPTCRQIPCRALLRNSSQDTVRHSAAQPEMIALHNIPSTNPSGSSRGDRWNSGTDPSGTASDRLSSRTSSTFMIRCSLRSNISPAITGKPFSKAAVLQGLAAHRRASDARSLRPRRGAARLRGQDRQPPPVGSVRPRLPLHRAPEERRRRGRAREASSLAQACPSSFPACPT